MRKGAFKELEIQKMGESMDQLKSLGFTTEARSLINQTEDTTAAIIEKSIGRSEQVGRHGLGRTAREAISFDENYAVKKSLESLTKGRPENEHLKGMRGEEHHADDEIMHDNQNEVVEIDAEHDQDKEVTAGPAKVTTKKSLTQEELLLKALGEIQPEPKEAPKKKSTAKCDGPAMPVVRKGPLVQWAKEEEAEKEHKETKKSVDHLADLCDIIKGGSLVQVVPDQNDPEVIANIHENSKELEKKAEEVPEMAKGFLKSAGPGGFVFDFGPKTGNPIADNATELLNRHGDKTQMEIASSQRQQYQNTLNTFVRKGHVDSQPVVFGEQDPAWNRQMNTPMDQQVAEAFQKGQLDEKTAGGPAIPAPGMAKSEAVIGGERVVAMSETDAAVLEMFKAEQAAMSTEGMNIADVSMGGAQRVTIDAKTGQAE